MKAILLKQPGHFEQIGIDEPKKPGPGEALVRVHRVGICGTDISGYLGKMPFYSYPRIPGHELGVEVLDVGAGRDQRQAGRSLLRRAVHQLPDVLRLPPRPAELLRESPGARRPHRRRHAAAVSSCRLASCTFRRKLTLEQLALVETLAIGCHAVNRAAPQPDEHVLVIGAGPDRAVGARIRQAHRREDHRARFERPAARFLPQTDGRAAHGATRCRRLGIGGVARDQRRRAADGGHRCHRQREFDVQRASTTSATPAGWSSSASSPSDVHFPDPLLHRREMTLLASRNALPDDFRRIIGLIEDGRIDTRPWITHRATFA